MKKLLIFMLITVLLLFLVSCQKKYLEISDVMNNKEEFINTVITIKGEVALDSFIKCTQQVCGEENPCCRSCSGSTVLKSDEVLIKLVSEKIKCLGNNCEITCSPLELNKQYIIEGTFKEKYGEYSLEIMEYTLVT